MTVRVGPRVASVCLLVVTTLIWGTTFPLLKGAIGSLSPLALVTSRFVIAALVMLPFVRSLNRSLLRDGALLGVIAFASYMTQVVGMASTSANRAAFITSLNVILVPLLGYFIGNRIYPRIWIAAALSLLGIGMMSWEGGALNLGDLWELGCALSYALYILLMEAAAPRHNALALTAVQLWTIALLGCFWVAPELGQQVQSLAMNWQAIVYLGLLATAATTWSQVAAQQQISATETAIIYTLEPVFAAVFSFWWLGESLGRRGLLGAGLVLVAMLLSQVPLQKLFPQFDRG